ncbi:MAG TPA: hypothetical protein VHO91_17195 [Rhodopila sp.]|nr:hypothetical protein [Rhodopila sp.]
MNPDRIVELIQIQCSRVPVRDAAHARASTIPPAAGLRFTQATICLEDMAPDLQILLQQLDQLAGDAERNGLPFVATALRNLTAMAAAEHRVATDLCA